MDQQTLDPTWHFLSLPLHHLYSLWPTGARKVPERRPSSLSICGEPPLRPHLSVFSTDSVAGISQLSEVTKGLAFLLKCLLCVGIKSTELVLPTVLLEEVRPTVSECVLVQVVKGL